MTISLPFPSSTVSSGYGYRIFKGSRSFHSGVDFAVAGNREVKAADSGTITKLEYTALKGYQLEITHSASSKTRYHMLRSDLATTVTEGQYVQKSQVIGHVAPVRYSANAAWTGPHLHFELWLKPTHSDGAAYGIWASSDPLRAVSNAGGGYTPSEPAGGSVTPIDPIQVPESLPTGESMKDWRVFRNANDGRIAVLTGGEFIVLNAEDYNKLREIIVTIAGRDSESGWIVPPHLNQGPAAFFNLDAHGWMLLGAINKFRG